MRLKILDGTVLINYILIFIINLIILNSINLVIGIVQISYFVVKIISLTQQYSNSYET